MSMRSRSGQSSCVPAPRVSVLLPVRDAEQTLRTCLRSLVRQSETRWECILIDDGSRDATLRVAQAFASRDPRFRLLPRRPEGLVAALQAGIAQCHAPFIARMDADDWMHRDRLAVQRSKLEEEPRLAGVGSHVRLFPRTCMSEGLRAYETWLGSICDWQAIEREAFVECPVAHPTLMMRRETLIRFGYRDLGWPEDYDLVLRLLRASERIGMVPRRLLGWRDGPTRLSRTSSAYGLDRFTACKAEHLAAGFLARTQEYTLWGYGRTARALRKALLAHDRHPSLIVEIHPRRLGQTIHGAPVVSPSELATHRRQPLVASVSGPGPRAEIRATLDALGLRETLDYVCAA